MWKVTALLVHSATDVITEVITAAIYSLIEIITWSSAYDLKSKPILPSQKFPVKPLGQVHLTRWVEISTQTPLFKHGLLHRHSVPKIFKKKEQF